MEIIRYAELKAQPWRNGGGVSREVASGYSTGADAGTTPVDRAQDTIWDWRVSIAEVTKAGTFSAFPGMDRVLTVIEGELLLLSVDGVEHPLEKYRPFRFSGEADSVGALPTGDIRDLNVITRQGVFKGYTSIIELSKKRAHPVFEGQLGILLQGQATVSPGTAGSAPGTAGVRPGAAGSDPSAAPAIGTAAGPGQAAAAEPATLERYDAVVGSDTASPEILGRGFLAVVSIDRVPSGF
ncbi:environmental stress-induced protein Ves [Arthrobacter sp. V4I6]|uniref:HutD/Ves family protein n=1 Tax=unclassified Arthrobacter TaxID=235627 RepID=UPI002785A074|nr:MULTISPECIES: HutD family protein [unclassified Arthrobacter]MDQ0819290.1 environmental stress-induced protein Ves [Arthrobacter sp. V1I7]MDQ0853474.1 environmental stress-induced protein Ves [Arthrobacter sp. V4I6]